MKNGNILEWFKAQISLGHIVIFVFMIGGFYYTTEYKFTSLETDIDRVDAKVENHVKYGFKSLRDLARDNKQQIQKVQGNYQALEKLIQQQQENDAKQFKQVNSRLDYIINRLDRQ